MTNIVHLHRVVHLPDDIVRNHGVEPVWAMRSDDRRSAALRAVPISVVTALRAAAAIAITYALIVGAMLVTP